ncbi:hypothetical protein NL676_033178 [Syzygium grande]|nr:hypothetical protein NL676_033178 [Syzygium grande]
MNLLLVISTPWSFHAHIRRSEQSQKPNYSHSDNLEEFARPKAVLTDSVLGGQRLLLAGNAKIFKVFSKAKSFLMTDICCNSPVNLSSLRPERKEQYATPRVRTQVPSAYLLNVHPPDFKATNLHSNKRASHLSSSTK